MKGLALETAVYFRPAGGAEGIKSVQRIPIFAD